MKRFKEGLAALVAAVGAPVLGQAETAPTAVSADYAESFVIAGMALDAETEFSIRLARFPGRETGALWIAAYVGNRRFAASDSGLSLGASRGKTPVEQDSVTLDLFGSSRAHFECRDRGSTTMTCASHAESRTHESFHPPSGPGSVPVTIDAVFEASHRGVPVRPGRIEVQGNVVATVTTPDGVYRLNVPGKWHEQTGERPRFGSAFTYLGLQGEHGGLLARTGESGSWGFFRSGDRVTLVRDFRIDPIGAQRRRFTVTLENQQTVEGEAVVKREASVPIEGGRRPGATVVADTSAGRMVGHLNDWDPPE